MSASATSPRPRFFGASSVGELLLIRILRYLILDDAAFVPRLPFVRLPQQQGVAGDDG